MCWGQAATVVGAYTGDMADVQLGLLTTTEDVLALAAELGEHDVTPAELRAWTADFERRVRSYADAPKKRGPYADVESMLARQRARSALLPLVEGFQARKRAAGAIDYADQVAYAAKIVKLVKLGPGTRLLIAFPSRYSRSVSQRRFTTKSSG